MAATVEAQRLIFVEECVLRIHLPGTDLRIRSERPSAVSVGTRKPGQEHYTLLSSMTTDGMGPSLTVEGATTARVFETYVERRCSCRASSRGRSW